MGIKPIAGDLVFTDKHQESYRTEFSALAHSGGANRRNGMRQKVYSVLTIDDDPAVLRAISRMLRSGFKVTGVSSVLEALSLLQQGEKFDVILLDLAMPDIDGFTAIPMLQELEHGRVTPIILLTGDIADTSQGKGLSLGAADYIQKPPSPEILRLRVRLHAENADLRAQLEALAYTDTLTGLMNRRGLQREFEREIRRCMRGSTSVTVMVLDIDHFKSVNDTYGHAVGDAAICSVAELLKQFFHRATDFVARLGGEEFVVFSSEQNQTEMELRLLQCRDAIKTAPLYDDGIEIERRISVSAGAMTLTCTQSSDFRLDRLIQRADVCLYKAKETRDSQVWEEN